MAGPVYTARSAGEATTVNEQIRFSMVIAWSNEDEAYVVTLPDWEGRVFDSVTHGDTYEAALRNGYEALATLVASASKRGEPLPEPRAFVSARSA